MVAWSGDYIFRYFTIISLMIPEVKAGEDFFLKAMFYYFVQTLPLPASIEKLMLFPFLRCQV